VGIAAGLAGALRLAKELPEAWVSSDVHAIQSPDDLTVRFKEQHILRPAFFPEGLSWPPREILARGGRDFAVLMHFDRAGSEQIVLALSQRLPTAPRLPTRIDPAREIQNDVVTVGGTPGHVSLARCSDGGACNRVTWERHGYDVELTGRLPEQELLRIAGSVR